MDHVRKPLERMFEDPANQKSVRTSLINQYYCVKDIHDELNLTNLSKGVEPCEINWLQKYLTNQKNTNVYIVV